MVRRLAAIAALLLVLAAAPGLAEDEKSKSACPQCGKIEESDKCEKDGCPLVRSDLVMFHNLLLALGGPDAGPIPGGHDNPFKALVKDKQIDLDALDKLVADYKAARKKAEFKNVDLFGKAQARMPGNEAAAIGALKTIAACEAIFREGDKDENGELDYGDLKAIAKAKLCDDVLGSGTKQGYKFECQPSTDKEKRCFCWWATASPVEPGKTGERYFFTNQAGVIYYSRKPIKIDDKIKESCEAPAGLQLIGR